ncbi:MAG: prepilin-type N-terminal cleavage/methylation domain-containing protein [Actinomycetia bacterium]|nr:prepilin-type N-terminal cleavage/methylation domain-containing protein [Actinomycetes bacterium]
MNQVRKSLLLLNKKIKDSKGFTLIELLLVAMLMFVVISMISAIYVLSVNTSRDVIEVTTSGIDSRVTIYRISKDLREATNLTRAENDEIIFTSNVDSDDDYEVVNYYLVNEEGYYNLYRKIDDGEAKIIVTHIVNNKLFDYYSDINTPSSDLDKIKIIKIYIYIDQGGTESPRTMKLETSVSLRNKM